MLRHMTPHPRRTQISIEGTPYFRCFSRVVRRVGVCNQTGDVSIIYPQVAPLCGRRVYLSTSHMGLRCRGHH